jgi:hypothetical protein
MYTPVREHPKPTPQLLLIDLVVVLVGDDHCAGGSASDCSNSGGTSPDPGTSNDNASSACHGFRYPCSTNHPAAASGFDVLHSPSEHRISIVGPTYRPSTSSLGFFQSHGFCGCAASRRIRRVSRARGWFPRFEPGYRPGRSRLDPQLLIVSSAVPAPRRLGTG